MYTDLKVVKRGSDSQDDRWFSKQSILKMRKAQKEIKWLLDRDYNIRSVINIVGNHYQFSSRQRNALMRSTALQKEIESRKLKCIPLNFLEGSCVYVDGFNLIITLEVALSASPIILCNDDTVRDLAGLRGTYSIIDKTDYALNIFEREINDLKISKVNFCLDRNVSNSGRLKKFILEKSQTWNADINVNIMNSVDNFLYGKEKVVTSDSIILDKCLSWCNFGKDIIRKYIPDARLINLT